MYSPGVTGSGGGLRRGRGSSSSFSGARSFFRGAGDGSEEIDAGRSGSGASLGRSEGGGTVGGGVGGGDSEYVSGGFGTGVGAGAGVGGGLNPPSGAPGSDGVGKVPPHSGHFIIWPANSSGTDSILWQWGHCNCMREHPAGVRFGPRAVNEVKQLAGRLSI